MKPPLVAGLLFSILLALAFWLPGLGERPFHNDEAVNALKFRALWQDGAYRYDPDEYHGPLLEYATWCLAKVSGWKSFAETNESNYRLLSVLTGVGLIALLALTADGLGQLGTFWAGLMIVLSSSLAYFSRSYIHEIWLVFSSYLLLASLWRYWRRPHWAWALLAGLAIGLMQATKETFVINIAALLLAGAACRTWGKLEAQSSPSPPRFVWRHLGLTLGMWLIVWLLLFSSFFTNASGLLDSVRTYDTWLNRAGGASPHLFPWPFYWERLFWFHRQSSPVWSELALFAFALIAVVSCVRRKGMRDGQVGFVRFLAVYTLVLFVVYSLIPYKTPWCILGAAHELALLAGVGVAVLWRIAWRLGQRVVLVVVLAAALVHLGWQSWALTHQEVCDRGNPWAYAATSPDILNLVRQIEALTSVAPAGADTPIQVACTEGDYWPLPFSLRACSHVGWYSKSPPRPFAPIVIISPKLAGEIESSETYVMSGNFQLRAGVFLRCYVEQDLWARLLGARERQ